ncbi:hypothetical protein QTA58_00285 [Neorhizobium sp. CSC1952]|uniref:hypothetical protein n=1 Tax=Neorhizobium sp. CSC1952 TaxID=2978974 RepID=UPI0025A53BE3|nr:hypothetical protein [Rhizobium sp. CSC1952]WJR67247.1 hypothetical protein QTA58_00285 [Rhizobium sp. CSC1952]
MAMTSPTFDDLIKVYRRLAFREVGNEAAYLLSDAESLSLIKQLADETATTGIHALVDLDRAKIGDEVILEVTKPKLHLGAFAKTFDELLLYPKARLREYDAYFIVDGAIERNSVPEADVQRRYRLCLKLLSLLMQAASYFDESREELVFIEQAKTVVPVAYDVDTLLQVDIRQVATLIDLFQGDIHLDQKLSLLAESVTRISAAHPLNSRFRYLLLNLEVVAEDLRQGYRLFASSFSYSKIRNEIETARVEYLGKIHKTIVDIQNQLLGIPVATIIVASQLKNVSECGLVFYTNWAVVAGAWIFLILLTVAIVNQWLTLSALRTEIGNQREKLNREYEAIGTEFADRFNGLLTRICWHQAGLVVVLSIATAGAFFATIAFNKVTTPTISACMAAA